MFFAKVKIDGEVLDLNEKISLDKNKKNVGTGLVGAPACGDVMKLQIELNDDG